MLPAAFWWTVGVIALVGLLGAIAMIFWYVKTYGRI